MQTNPNPQKSTSTAVPVEPSAATTTASEPTSDAAAAKPKSTRTVSKASRSQRRTTKPAGVKKPAARRSQTGKATEKTSSAPASAVRGPREGSTMWAVLKVLDTANGPLSAKDIYAQIAERKLANGLQGKTPDQTVAAALAVAAKQGRYVERAAPGMFQLRKDHS